MMAIASQAEQTEDRPALIGLARLMRMARNGIDLMPYVSRAACSPDDATMLMGLSIFFHFSGNPLMALELQTKALALCQQYRIDAPGGAVGIRLLLLLRAGEIMDNTPVDFLLEESDVELHLVYLGDGLPLPEVIPDHDLVLVAVSQSDQNQALLRQISNALQHWPRPVLNRAERIASLSRDGVSAALGSISGINLPTSYRIVRTNLDQATELEHEWSIDTSILPVYFPLIIRPLDSHGGKGLARIRDGIELASYLRTNADEWFYVAPYVDYSNIDGLFRKYRIVLIDGHPYACHMAISDHWIVHYLNAGMGESIEKRIEESNFFACFDADFAQRHRAAFLAIHQRLDVDYLVIDCAETRDGRLLVFEVDNTGFVHAFDAVNNFAYKLAPMRRLFSAFYSMLQKRIAF